MTRSRSCFSLRTALFRAALYVAWLFLHQRAPAGQPVYSPVNLQNVFGKEADAGLPPRFSEYAEGPGYSTVPLGAARPSSHAAVIVPREKEPTCTKRCADNRRLFGVIASSDRAFHNFISPMTNFVFFEDPRTLSELRPVFLHHNVPGAAGGGSVQLYALQARAALTERLSIVATKDGFATSSNPLIDDGWADVAAGLKYNLYRDPVKQRLLSTGVTYELPVGTPRTLQGNGDGEFHVYLTGGVEFAEHWHWLSATGFRLPANTNQESQVWYWSNHWDYQVTPWLYGLFEVNWYHWLKSGNGGIPGVEGIDLFNFGSRNVAGLDLATIAFGVKFKPTDRMEVGVAYEFPVTGRKFIMENRLTADWIIRY